METIPEQMAIMADEPSEPSGGIPGVSLADFARLCAQIVIMVPHRQSEGVNESIQACGNQWGRWSLLNKCIEDEFSGDIAFTRAGMVRKFLDMCAELDASPAREGLPPLRYLVMIDNDELIYPLAPVMLAFNDLPVVSGVVCSPSNHGILKACFTMADAFGIPRFPTVKHTRKMPVRGVKEIHSAGAGLICIRRDVLEAIVTGGKHPFLMTGAEHDAEVASFWRSGTKKLGEDMHFCRQARDAGYAISIDFGVIAGHVKETVVVWPPSYLDPTMSAADWKIDVGDYAHGE